LLSLFRKGNSIIMSQCQISKPKVILHVDMDAFFASIEQLDNPDYRGKPVVVGADPKGGKGRGVVSAASYEARKFNIHSAMPISHAYRLCPDAVFVRPRMERYVEVSKEVMKILHFFSPLVEQLSIDEAFLDCTGTEKLFGPPEAIARKLKQEIKEKIGLTSSIGIATNKSVAKIASELGKPDGLVICCPGKEEEFLAHLPLKMLWGAGKKTVDFLTKKGFTKIGDIAVCPREEMGKLLGKIGTHLWNLSKGIDPRPVETDNFRKSISEETTFMEDVSDDGRVELVLFGISDELTRRMRTLGLKGRTVTLKIRLEDFSTFTKSRSLEKAVSDTFTVRSCAVEMYRSFDRKGKKVRLVGIGISRLEGLDDVKICQPELFDGKALDNEDTLCGKEMGKHKGKITDELLDRLKKKYGERVTRASFLNSSNISGER